MILQILAATSTSYFLNLTILPRNAILNKDLKEMHNFCFNVPALESERNVSQQVSAAIASHRPAKILEFCQCKC